MGQSSALLTAHHLSSNIIAKPAVALPSAINPTWWLDTEDTHTQQCTTPPATSGRKLQQQSAHPAPYAMGVLTSILLATCVVCCASSGRAETQISAPIFAWSSVGYFSGGDDKQGHVQSLETHSSMHDFFQQLLTQEQVLQHRPEVLLAVLGSQVKSSHLKSRVMNGALQPLKHMLEQSTSSLSAPYVMHQAVGARDDHVTKLQQLAADMQLKASVVGCAADSSDSLDSVLQAQQQGAHLVVLCTTPPSPTAAGTPEAVAAELQQLQQAHDLVAQLGKRQLTVYAAVPEASAGVHMQRQLRSVQADVGTCGQLCQTQVKWLEGILAVFIMAFAVFSGMCCLYSLDTPTKFEKPKEGPRND